MNSAAAPPLSLHPPPPLRPPYNISPVLISVIGALGSIFLVVSYYQLLLRYCSCFESIVRRGAGRNDEGFVSEDEASGSGLDISLIAKIPIVKYSARDSKSGTECSVCLTEFSEGELVRVLPKCRHAFHIACIGFWLNTHHNCPLCRANIARSLFDSPSPEKREVVAAPSGHEIEPRDSHFLAFYDAPAATANAVERPLPRSLSYAGSSHLSPESASSSQWYRRFRWSTRTSSPSEEMRSRLLESEASLAHKDCNERALEVAINFDGPVNISNGGQGASFATKRELL